MTSAFTALDLPGVRAWVRPEAEGWVRAVVGEGGTLFEAASRHPERIELHGRGPAYAIPAPGRGREGGRPPGGRGRRSDRSPGSGAGDAGGDRGSSRWLVRHYRRGGAVAPLLGDRYLRLGTPRPFRELAASEAVRARGVETPRVVAATVHPAGPFYRGDLVTEFVEGARDLAEILFPEATRRAAAGAGDPAVAPEEVSDDPASARRALAAAGALVGELARAGIHHRDLNAKNVLLVEGDDGLRTLVLDLDRCRLDAPGAELSPEGMLQRLLRSLEKFETTTGRELPDGGREALVGAAQEEETP